MKIIHYIEFCFGHTMWFGIQTSVRKLKGDMSCFSDTLHYITFICLVVLRLR